MPRRVPTLIHEAPLVVLREAPALIATLLRESLGVELPAFATAEVGDAGFTQAVPAELRADLVVHLRGGPPDHAPLMGIVVEVQRARDDAKRRTWPLYVAALHARLRCPTCLVVITDDDAVARWAAVPIASLQPGSPFVPLVLGPRDIPRLSLARARHEPWLAVLAALVHRRDTEAKDEALTALSMLSRLSRDQARVCYVLLDGPRHVGALEGSEDVMNQEEYSPLVSRLAEQALANMTSEWQQLALSFASRRGGVSDELRARVIACNDRATLRELIVDVADAPDAAAVERILGSLPPAPTT